AVGRRPASGSARCATTCSTRTTTGSTATSSRTRSPERASVDGLAATQRSRDELADADTPDAADEAVAPEARPLPIRLHPVTQAGRFEVALDRLALGAELRIDGRG